MCNQCGDLRAIHSGKIVWGVFHNGKMQMVQGTESQALRTVKILDGSAGRLKWCQCGPDDECVWEVYQIERKDVSWETRWRK